MVNDGQVPPDDDCPAAADERERETDDDDETDLLIQPIAQLGDAALDLVELAALLLPISLDNIHMV